MYRFVQALDVWRHPFWETFAHDDIDEYCAFVREQTDLRLGIEADFVPGAEDRMANLLEARPFDYVVGSVHFMRDGAVDMDDYSVWDSSGARSAEEVWKRYFEAIGEAARSGLFDIAAHPDLVKYWNDARRTPEGDLRRFYEPAVEGIYEGGIAVEVSTAGLRKPAGEIYPARAFLEMCVRRRRARGALQRRAPPRGRRRRLRARARAARRRGRARAVRVRGARAALGADRRRRHGRVAGGLKRSRRAMSLVGIGFDSHRLAAGRRLVIGGVEIPYEKGLDGHSDADVLAHAVTDALLGAAGMGDIGEHFPDTDERWRDADSMQLLASVAQRVREAGLEIANVDCTVVMEAPKLSPHRDAIRQRLATTLGLERARVSVKASTGEGMGFVGRGEGVAALAVAGLRDDA